MDNIIKDCLSALDRLENDALNSRDGYGYSGGDAETIRRAISENESLRRENEELKAKLDKAKWQPIETAPKDGKSILVTDGFEVCDAYFRGGDWWQYECGDDWYSTSINPTHWMPLPDAPEQR